MDSPITYDFTFEDGQTFHFSVPAQGWVETDANRDEPRPEWTLLAVDRCPGCPLDAAVHRYCPAAVDLHGAAARFSAIASFRKAQVVVTVGTRTYSSHVDMNTGLRSLFGLYLALGGCPVTRRLRPLALQHVPFSSLDETLTRVAGHYLLKQYFALRDGGTPDWEMAGLVELYRKLDDVNSALMQRLRRASERDSNLNALCGFATFSRIYAMALDDVLADEKERLRHGF